MGDVIRYCPNNVSGISLLPNPDASSPNNSISRSESGSGMDAFALKTILAVSSIEFLSRLLDEGSIWIRLGGCSAHIQSVSWKKRHQNHVQLVDSLPIPWQTSLQFTGLSDRPLKQGNAVSSRELRKRIFYSATSFVLITSAYHSPESFTMRFWVAKSTWINPKRLEKPKPHSKLSIKDQTI